MMILITYDVETVSSAGQRRLRRVSKECKNYGIRVQNSVFECVVDTNQFLILKNKLASIIDEKHDSVRFYFMGKNWERHIEMIGKNRGINVMSTLVI